MKNLAIVRSNTRTEGDHMRGTVLTSTGRSPNPLSEWPSLGSMLSYLHKDFDADLPSFISVGGAGGARGPGFLGMKFAPFTVQNPGQPPENIKAEVSSERMARRADLFGKLESGFVTSTKAEKDAAKQHQEIYDKALSLVVSKNKEVFGLDKDTDGKSMNKTAVRFLWQLGGWPRLPPGPQARGNRGFLRRRQQRLRLGRSRQYSQRSQHQVARDGQGHRRSG